MRIVSKRKDYYDSAMGYGQDPSIVYVRNEQIFERYLNETLMIGFCGKIYPYIHYSKLSSIEHPNGVSEYCYNEEQYRKCIEKYEDKKTLDYYLTKDYWSLWARKYVTKQENKLIYFNADYSKFTKLFREYNTPIWYYHQSESFIIPRKYYLTINPQLKPLQFAKAVDPFQAFQEISMYLGGILGTGNPSIPEISDRDLLEAKGFDYKFSFRKDKQK